MLSTQLHSISKPFNVTLTISVGCSLLLWDLLPGPDLLSVEEQHKQSCWVLSHTYSLWKKNICLCAVMVHYPEQAPTLWPSELVHGGIHPRKHCIMLSASDFLALWGGCRHSLSKPSRACGIISPSIVDKRHKLSSCVIKMREREEDSVVTAMSAISLRHCIECIVKVLIINWFLTAQPICSIFRLHF